VRIALFSLLFVAIFVADALLVADTQVFAQNSSAQIKLNGGMEARVNFAGRSKDHNQPLWR
jgi:hypothetical protein